MSRNTWIILISVVIVIVSMALVLLLILIPQVDTVSSIEEYQSITKSDYTYTPTKDDVETQLIEQYSVTSKDVKNGVNSKDYIPGNDNPFTPNSDIKKDVNVYNEDNKTLTPSDK